MPFIYIQDIQTKIIQPYDDVTEFFDTIAMTLEEKQSFIRYGRNTSHACVAKEVYDAAEELDS